MGNPNTLAAPTETTAAPPNPIVEPELVIDRYELFRRIGQGGMASVHLARQVGGVGFSRVVAVKRLHSHLAASHEFVALFLDEARLAARVRHQNVVSTLDVVERQDETLLVMEYVEGATLSQLAKRRYGPDSSPSLAIVSAVFVGALRGLHAAHEARSELGAPLHLVHRDISPQNIIVGTDGVPRLLDFGVAKAQGQLHTTLIGALRGKLAYMAPEHIRHGATKASDVYAMAVIMWETLADRRLRDGATPVEIMTHVLEASVPPLSSVGVGVPSRVESILERALASDPRDRFSSAAEMADAVAASVPPASASEVGAWVERTMSDRLPSVRALSAAIQARSSREQPRTPSLVAAPVSAAAEPPRTKPETDLAAAETRVVFVPRSRPQWHRRGRAALVILGLVAAFFGGRLSRAPDVSQAVQQPPRAALVSPQTIAAAAPDVEVPAIAAVERARVTPTVSAIASSGVAPAAVTAPIASSVPRLPPRLPRHDCTPPYEVDAKGARRVKVRCFKPEQAIPRHI